MPHSRGSVRILHSHPTRLVFRLLSSSHRKVAICNYEVLGLTPNATTKDIKEAYYEKSKQYHPDMNPSPDAALNFQKVNSAYEVLASDQSRLEYDISKGYRRFRSGQVTRPGDSDLHSSEVPFDRTIYSRLRKKSAEAYKAKGSFDYKEKTWKRVKTEDEFMEHLSPEMKAAFQAYKSRMAQENEEARQNRDAMSNDSLLSVFALLICAFMLVAMVDGFEGTLDRKATGDKKKGD